MPKSVWGIVRNGRIEPSQEIDLPEGSRVLVTLLADEEHPFWQDVSDTSLAAIWDNTEDDVYAQLLET